MVKLIQGFVLVVVLAVGGLAFRLVMLRYAADSIQKSVQTFGQQQVVIAQRESVMARAQSSRMAAPPVDRVLAAKERCIGGSIVRVETINGVPTYTQLQDGFKAVMCP